MSRIGKKPVDIPKEVKCQIQGQMVSAQGPKGKLELKLHQRISAEVKGAQVFVQRSNDTKLDKSLHGLSRALIFNIFKGVSEGYKKELEIIGVGFKAQVQAKTLNLQLSYSHPVDFPIPEGIAIKTPKPTQIVVEGVDKELVGETAAEIRGIFPPEPYKGKGIRYLGEYVKKKVGKAQATTK